MRSALPRSRLRVVDPPIAAFPADTSRRLAELSHDLRTPLTSVRLLVRALRDGLVSGERRSEYLAQIERQVVVLSAMVDQLHSASREDAGDPNAMLDCLAPRGLIEATVETMAIQAQDRGVTLELDVQPCLPTIRARPIQLHRALLNVIENAIRHARDGGTVSVRAQRTTGGVEIEVADDGEGIAADERDQVFLAFHGSDRRRSHVRSGLGLAIARAAVEAHGGRIWLAESDQGTRVRLSLPALAESSAPRSDGHSARAQF